MHMSKMSKTKTILLYKGNMQTLLKFIFITSFEYCKIYFD